MDLWLHWRVASLFPATPPLAKRVTKISHADYTCESTPSCGVLKSSWIRFVSCCGFATYVGHTGTPTSEFVYLSAPSQKMEHIMLSGYPNVHVRMSHPQNSTVIPCCAQKSLTRPQTDQLTTGTDQFMANNMQT